MSDAGRSQRSTQRLFVPTLYRYLFPAMWLAWAIYWWISARNVKSAMRCESSKSRLAHIGPLFLTGILFCVPARAVGFLGDRILPAAPWQFALAAGLTAAGLLFSVWARRYLGSNWSATVTIKHDHELVTGGPYRIVRHPIYTGLLLALLGSAIALGQWRGFLAVAIAFIALWRKLRLEEQWMRQQFGEVYTAYSRRVAALVPFVL